MKGTNPFPGACNQILLFQRGEKNENSLTVGTPNINLILEKGKCQEFELFHVESTL